MYVNASEYMIICCYICIYNSKIYLEFTLKVQNSSFITHKTHSHSFLNLNDSTGLEHYTSLSCDHFTSYKQMKLQKKDTVWNNHVLNTAILSKYDLYENQI